MVIEFSLENINEVATRFWNMADSRRVFAFHGGMGVGKTTFIHSLCLVKGVKDAVTSPTYSIINEYSFQENGSPQSIFHLDLYRVKNEAEAIQAGVEDCLYTGAICLVEWPDKAPGIFPEGTMHIYLEVVDFANRKLRMDDKIS